MNGSRKTPSLVRRLNSNEFEPNYSGGRIFLYDMKSLLWNHTDCLLSFYGLLAGKRGKNELAKKVCDVCEKYLTDI